ncbi:MAG TPA: DNA-formamidopyrimidine glycosylase family protein [Roseiflexaceae bacterium]|nr:DNA-formamidopyrimidine glycosylase family protein [Roseiflexaceae bacterium]
MAEVPEVETIVRDLRGAVVGRELRGAEVLQPEALRFPTPEQLDALLAGRAVVDAQRRGKHILLPLADDLLLELHFMLWGTLRLVPSGTRRPPETMVVYHLDGDEELHLRDKLGYARTALDTSAALVERLDLDALGPDALNPDFNTAVLAGRLARRRGALKSVLINPRVLTGLGNRDADESLWLARIDPRRIPATLTAEELERLRAAIGQVLEEGLALRGTQADLFGQQGRAKHRRYVFERTGMPCPRCGTRIEHLRLGGRNTHFCPTCQKF